jgi:hypothetical protein
MRRPFASKRPIGPFRQQSDNELLTIDSLYNKVNEYQKEVAKQRNNTGSELDDELIYELLIGSCDDNSILLAQYLSSICSNDILRVSGATDYPNEPTPKSEQEAKVTGTSHYWLLVEVPNQDPHPYANVDLITNSENIPKYEPTVQIEKPEDYIMFKVTDSI